jgi:hypothetical protein
MYWLMRPLVAICLLSLLACAGAPPIEEYTIARSAMTAAKAAESSRYASGFWYKAEDLYAKARKSYDERDFKKAKSQFELTIQYAERAENASRLLRLQSGEVFP